MVISPVLLAPHLPTLLVDEHRGHLTPMLQAFALQAEALEADRPDVVVALSSRWDSDGPFLIDAGKRLRTLTDYNGFGVEVRYDCDGAPAIARDLVEAATRAGLRAGAAKRGVDSGVTVPLHFLLPRRTARVVPVSLAHAEPASCRAFGAVLRATLERREERVLFVVGGLLSANMHAWNFRREMPETQRFDERLLAALETASWERLEDFEPALLEKAQPDAGLRHLEVLRGFLGEGPVGVSLAYESAPGVGAALVQFELTHADATTQGPSGKV